MIFFSEAVPAPQKLHLRARGHASLTLHDVNSWRIVRVKVHGPRASPKEVLTPTPEAPVEIRMKGVAGVGWPSRGFAWNF